MADDKFIVPKFPSAPVVGAGLDSVSLDLLPIPTIRVTQPSSKPDILGDGNEAPVGGLFHTGILSSRLAIPCAVLRISNSRSYYVKDDDKSILMCRSRDAKVGNPFGPCNVCKCADWVSADGDKNAGALGVPPACKLSFDLLCLDDESKEPFRISARGTSFSAGRRLYASMVYARKPAFAHKVVIETKLIKTDEYKYCILVFRLLGLRETDEVQFLEGFFNKYGVVTGAGDDLLASDDVVEVGDISDEVPDDPSTPF